MTAYDIVQYRRKTQSVSEQLVGISPKAGVDLISFLGDLDNWNFFVSLVEDTTNPILKMSGSLPKIGKLVHKIDPNCYVFKKGKLIPNIQLCEDKSPRTMKKTKLNIGDLKKKLLLNTPGEGQSPTFTTPELFFIKFSFDINGKFGKAIASLYIYTDPENNQVYTLFETPYIKERIPKKVKILLEDILWGIASRVTEYEEFNLKLSFFEFELLFEGIGVNSVY